MNAQQLLNQLQQIVESGVDLSTLEVVVPWESYDGYAYVDGERYPDYVNIVNNELRLD